MGAPALKETYLQDEHFICLRALLSPLDQTAVYGGAGNESEASVSLYNCDTRSPQLFYVFYIFSKMFFRFSCILCLCSEKSIFLLEHWLHPLPHWLQQHSRSCRPQSAWPSLLLQLLSDHISHVLRRNTFQLSVPHITFPALSTPLSMCDFCIFPATRVMAGTWSQHYEFTSHSGHICLFFSWREQIERSGREKQNLSPPRLSSLVKHTPCKWEAGA